MAQETSVYLLCISGCLTCKTVFMLNWNWSAPVDHFSGLKPPTNIFGLRLGKKTLVWWMFDEHPQTFNEDLVWLIQPMKAGTEPRPIGLSENGLPPIQWQIISFPHCNGLVGTQFSEEPILRWITSLQWWWKHKTQLNPIPFTGGSSLHGSKLQKKMPQIQGIPHVQTNTFPRVVGDIPLYCHKSHSIPLTSH